MKTSQILSWLLALAGEIVLIYGMIYCFPYLPTDLLVLDTAVATVVYACFCSNLLIPLIRRNDVNHDGAASLGIRWVAMFIYSVAAIGGMIAMWQYGVKFGLQLLAQLVAVLLLTGWLLAAMRSGEHAAEVGRENSRVRTRLSEARNAVESVAREIMAAREVDPRLRNLMGKVCETMRYTSPSTNPDATRAEKEIEEQAAMLHRALLKPEGNSMQIRSLVESLDELTRYRASMMNR